MKKIKLLEAENVVFSGKRHWISYVAPYAIVVLIAAAAIGLTVLIKKGADADAPWGMYVLLVWIVAAVAFLFPLFNIIRKKKSSYVITDKRLILSEGWIKKQYFEQFLTKCDTVTVDQSVMGNIFNYGTVTSTSSGKSVSFGFVGKARQFRETLAAEMDKAQNARRVWTGQQS